jgi:hypothetical protein
MVKRSMVSPSIAKRRWTVGPVSARALSRVRAWSGWLGEWIGFVGWAVHSVFGAGTTCDGLMGRVAQVVRARS